MNEFIYTFVPLQNMSGHIGITLLFCLGFFLTPNDSFACSKHTAKTEQKSCQKENSKTKDCCKTKSCKKDKKGSGHCGADCPGKSCNNTSHSSLGLPILLEINTKSFLAFAEKRTFGFKEAYYSSDNISIWLPPKIG